MSRHTYRLLCLPPLSLSLSLSPPPPPSLPPFSPFSIGQNDDELSCVANESVVILEDLGDGWLRVRKGQIEGYVPQAYVQIIE